MKYTFMSFILQYYLSKFARPLLIPSSSSLNFEALAMVPHIFRRNSKTGIVRQTTGSLELEKDCCAVAGSCHHKLNSQHCRACGKWHRRLTFINSCRTLSCSHSRLDSSNHLYFFFRSGGTSSLLSASTANLVRACA